MSTSSKTIDHLLDQLAGLESVSAKKMFGEYCLYLADKAVGVVCDDQLFLKPTTTGRALIRQVVEAAPYKGAKHHFLVAADQWESTEWLKQLIQATATELPVKEVRNKKTQQ